MAADRARQRPGKTRHGHIAADATPQEIAIAALQDGARQSPPNQTAPPWPPPHPSRFRAPCRRVRAGNGASGRVPYPVGDRWLPSTPLTDDPFVADALYSAFQHSRQVDTPNFGENNLTMGFEKRLTDQLGVSFAGSYEILTPPDRAMSTAGTMSTRPSIPALSAPHETVPAWSAAELAALTSRVGAAPWLHHQSYAAKGFPTRPASRVSGPFAVTGTFGIQVPDDGSMAATVLPIWRWPASLQYSLKYLQGNVEYIGLPPLIGRLIPSSVHLQRAGVARARQRADRSGGAWYHLFRQRARIAEALPINRASGTGIGVTAKAHIPLDRIAARPAPLFGD